MNSVTFDKSVKEFILGVFDKKVNKEGIIVERTNPEQEVLAQDGQEITLDQFGGIKKGSEVFIKSDLISLLKLSDILK